MKKKLLVIMLAGLLWPATEAQAQSQTLVLTHADGTTTEVELYSQPHIRLTADKMTISSPVVSLEYAKADVVRFHYKNVGTGVSPVGSPTGYRIDPGGIFFHGVDDPDRITVYSVSGTRIPVSLSASGSDAVLSLARLPRGVYLVTFNDKTIKFVRP